MVITYNARELFHEVFGDMDVATPGGYVDLQACCRRAGNGEAQRRQDVAGLFGAQVATENGVAAVEVEFDLGRRLSQRSGLGFRAGRAAADFQQQMGGPIQSTRGQCRVRAALETVQGIA